MSKQSVNFVIAFQQALDEGGDMFFSLEDYDKDVQTITGTIKQQGYWAGVRLRYYFDNKMLGRGIVKLLKTEERIFGNGNR